MVSLFSGTLHCILILLTYNFGIKFGDVYWCGDNNYIEGEPIIIVVVIIIFSYDLIINIVIYYKNLVFRMQHKPHFFFYFTAQSLLSHNYDYNHWKLSFFTLK